MASGSMLSFAMATSPAKPAKRPADPEYVSVSPNPNGRTFFDVASEATLLVEKLTTKLKAKAMRQSDTSYCTVNIAGPYGKPGKFTADISLGDVENFAKYQSIWLSVRIGSSVGLGNHAVALMRNAKTGLCEIHDSNGSLANTYPDGAKELIKAIQLGLLRPLISPEPGPPAAPFSVSFPYAEDGPQGNERELCGRATGYLSEGKLKFESRIGKPIFASLLEYLHEDTPGFCVTWALFKIVDNAKNGLRLFNVVEQALLDIEDYQQGYYTVWNYCEQAWRARFFKETNSKMCKSSDKLFQSMFIPIFVRKLADFFVRAAEQGLTLASAEDWWPTGEDVDISDLIKRISKKDEPVLDFRKEGDPPEFYYTRGRYLGSTYFPFPQPDPTGNHLSKLWKCSVDTSRPFNRTLKLTATAPRKRHAASRE